ncbi:MAG: hypothetical protein GY885_18210, partial [Phycisphaeraceae bacterium]|nr:hypothetical protein [Phycisphaeraceae bacterium]
DWDAVRLEYRPMVEDTRTEDEVRVVLSRMLNELGQSHFVIIPAPEKIAESTTEGDPVNTGIQSDGAEETPEDDATEGDLGNTGIRLDWADGVPTVAFVREGSTGDQAGVRPGWRLQKIDGRDPSDRIAAVREAAKEADSAIANFEAVQMLNAAMMGSVGDTRTFTFLDGDDESTEVELGFAGEPGVAVKFGNLPAMTTRCTSRVLS